jgi:hypothetical protein
MSKKPVKPSKTAAPASKGGSAMSANVAAILGLSNSGSKSKNRVAVANGAPKIKPEWSKYYEILLDLRERLRNQMAGLAKDCLLYTSDAADDM